MPNIRLWIRISVPLNEFVIYDYINYMTDYDYDYVASSKSTGRKSRPRSPVLVGCCLVDYSNLTRHPLSIHPRVLQSLSPGVTLKGECVSQS